MRKIIFMISILFMFVNSVYSSDIEDVEKLIKTTINDAIVVLKKNELDNAIKKNEIMKIVNPIFAFDLMAKLSLGKKNWPKFDPEQKKEFKSLFIKQLQSSYFDKALLFSDEEIIYERPVKNKKKINITTIILSKGEKFKLLYKLFFKNNVWKIYDLEIQDISIIKSYGSQYDQELAKGTVNDLLDKMKSKNIKS